MTTLLIALPFGFGLLIGSFANVVIHRVPRMLVSSQEQNSNEHYDLCWPASHCPNCHTELKLWHNIPVLSFLVLKGRCSFCKQPISTRYPIIEVANALIWSICSLHWGMNLTGICWAVFGTMLLVLSVIDWTTTLLPDTLTQALLWTGLMASSTSWLSLDLYQAVWGAMMGYASLWTVANAFKSITGKQGMGPGDFKLFAALGAWLGPLALLPTIIFASLGSITVSILLRQTKYQDENGELPFGPFLALSSVLIVFTGVDVFTRWLGW